MKPIFHFFIFFMLIKRNPYIKIKMYYIHREILPRIRLFLLFLLPVEEKAYTRIKKENIIYIVLNGPNEHVFCCCQMSFFQFYFDGFFNTFSQHKIFCAFLLTETDILIFIELKFILRHLKIVYICF